MQSTARLLPLDLCGGWLLPPDLGGKSRHHQIRVEDSPAAANAPCLTLVSSRCRCQICSDPCRGRAPLPDPRGFWRGMTAIAGSEWGRLSLPIRAENSLVPTTVSHRAPPTAAARGPASRYFHPHTPAASYSSSSPPLATPPRACHWPVAHHRRSGGKSTVRPPLATSP